MKKIILINGKKRHGKDYLARMLAQSLKDFGESAEIMGFADTLKRIISKTLDITIEDLEKYKNHPDTFLLYYMRKNPHVGDDQILQEINFRQILQTFGTEAMKDEFGQDVWVKLLEERAQKSSANFIIVPDFRFLCEQISPCTVKIFNNDIVENDNHRSENELNDFKFNHIIDNTGRLDISQQVKTLAISLIS